MQFEVPQWLPPAFVRAVQGAGSPLPREDLVAACAAILERWSTPDRVYHGVQHLIDTAAMLETLIPETHEPGLVRLAAWYHGIVFSTDTTMAYNGNAGEDEASSAEFARADLLRLGVCEKKAKRVADLVKGLRSTPETRPDESAQLDAIDIDLLALRDAHMGTLSVDPQRYKKYTACIRKEYLHIPLVDFLQARRKIVERLLGRSKLFITPLAQQWEEPTRENLNAEAIRLAAKLEVVEREGAEHAALDDSAWIADSSASPSTGSLTRVSDDGPAARIPPAQRRDLRDTLSSLEACGERIDPGEKAPPADLTSEELKQRKRELLAAKVRKRVEDRHSARARSAPAVQQPPVAAPVAVASPVNPVAVSSDAPACASATAVASPSPAAPVAAVPTATTPFTAETAATPPRPVSTATPEWVDEDDVDANAPASGSGMEREPDL